MNKKYIYLAGPIAQCSYKEANDWRDYVSNKLHENIIGKTSSYSSSLNNFRFPSPLALNSKSALIL